MKYDGENGAAHRAALDSERRGSKRQKDLADISRILENYPQYRSRVPQGILEHLLE